MSSFEMFVKIEKELKTYLEPLKNDFSEIGFDFEMIAPSNEIEESYIEITGYSIDEYHPTKKQPFMMLVITSIDDDNQLQIPNIFLPMPMHHFGIGLKMIDIIRKIAQEYDYELFIVDMVNSFYNRMRNRKAAPCIGCDDAVCITEMTDLSYHY